MRYISIILLILLCCVFIRCSQYSKDGDVKSYKVVKINSASEYYLDFNGHEEFVKLSSIEPFTPTLLAYNSPLKRKNITNTENIRNYYLAKDYLDANVLNKTVKVQILSKNKPYIVRMYLNDKDLVQTLLENGFATVKPFTFDFLRYFRYENIYKIKKNAFDANNLDFYILNNQNHKYHTLDCKYGAMLKDYKVVRRAELPKDADECHFCAPYDLAHLQLNGGKDSNDAPPFKSDNFELYLLDFTHHPKPNKECKNYTCQALVQLINHADKTIDMALYTIYHPKILRALEDAQKRGVRIRMVTEGDNYKNFPDSMARLERNFANIKNDSDSDGNKRSLMHDKFFIFDGKTVYTGSTNISGTDLSGFNANAAMIINSPALAKIYLSEFEQMYDKNLYHKAKANVTDNKDIKINDKMTVDVYFSPKDHIITNQIIPLIQNAKKYIYVPVFIITHKEMSEALIEAKKRGVDVRLITDATGAWNKYASNNMLRENGVPVKVENLAGKMHMKSVIIDDETTVIGSMNFTLSGENANDESVLVIHSEPLTKYYKSYFLRLWAFIPDKWLKQTPHAESLDSVGSCFDGIDNNFDGKIDSEDPGCKIIPQPAFKF